MTEEARLGLVNGVVEDEEMQYQMVEVVTDLEPQVLTELVNLVMGDAEAVSSIASGVDPQALATFLDTLVSGNGTAGAGTQFSELVEALLETEGVIEAFLQSADAQSITNLVEAMLAEPDAIAGAIESAEAQVLSELMGVMVGNDKVLTALMEGGNAIDLFNAMLTNDAAVQGLAASIADLSPDEKDEFEANVGLFMTMFDEAELVIPLDPPLHCWVLAGDVQYNGVGVVEYIFDMLGPLADILGLSREWVAVQELEVDIGTLYVGDQ
jgi:hypothetical protein